MNKKLREILNGAGLVVSAFAMMAAGVAVIYIVMAVYHAVFK